jgi:hypothetical protein
MSRFRAAGGAVRSDGPQASLSTRPVTLHCGAAVRNRSRGRLHQDALTNGTPVPPRAAAVECHEYVAPPELAARVSYADGRAAVEGVHGALQAVSRNHLVRAGPRGYAYPGCRDHGEAGSRAASLSCCKFATTQVPAVRCSGHNVFVGRSNEPVSVGGHPRGRLW